MKTTFNKTRFAEFASSVSIHMARELALSNGVAPAVVELWVNQIVRGN